MDEVLLKKVNGEREGDEEGGGAVQFNHHIFSLIRDIIYTKPLNTSRESTWCQLHRSSQYIFLPRPLLSPFCCRLCLSIYFSGTLLDYFQHLASLS